MCVMRYLISQLRPIAVRPSVPFSVTPSVHLRPSIKLLYFSFPTNLLDSHRFEGVHCMALRLDFHYRSWWIIECFDCDHKDIIGGSNSLDRRSRCVTKAEWKESQNLFDKTWLLWHSFYLKELCLMRQLVGLIIIRTQMSWDLLLWKYNLDGAIVFTEWLLKCDSLFETAIAYIKPINYRANFVEVNHIYRLHFQAGVVV